MVPSCLVNGTKIIHRRTMALLIATVLAALVSFFLASHAQTSTLRRTTNIGQEVRVFAHTEHRSDCSQGS